MHHNIARLLQGMQVGLLSCNGRSGGLGAGLLPPPFCQRGEVILIVIIPLLAANGFADKDGDSEHQSLHHNANGRPQYTQRV